MMSQQISVRLALPETVQAHSQIKGSLEITSRTDETVELVSPHCNAALNLVVFNSLWDEVRAGSLGKVHIADQRFELAPGQTVRFELTDLAFTTGSSRMAYKLPSGIYYVLAIYHPGTTRRPDQSSYPIAVPSNVAKLTVV